MDSTVVAVLLGYGWQWARAFKAFPTWLANVLVAVGGVALYTFTLQKGALPHDWDSTRAWVFAAIGFLLTSRGTASVASGIGAAPKTNGLVFPAKVVGTIPNP